MKRQVLVGAAGLLFATGLLALVGPELHDFWARDRCLDRGGRWDRDRQTCQAPRDR